MQEPSSKKIIKKEKTVWKILDEVFLKIAVITLIVFFIYYGLHVLFVHNTIKHNFVLGISIDDQLLRTDDKYEQALLSFNVTYITPENAMKMYVTNPKKNVYDLSRIIQVLEYAKQHNLKVRAHTLIWTMDLPEWVYYHNTTKTDLYRYYEYILWSLKPWNEYIYAWDILNEYYNSGGCPFITKSYCPYNEIKQWYTIARNILGNKAKLFYNDYNNGDLSTTSNDIFKWIKLWLEWNIPLDGIGFQFHMLIEQFDHGKDVEQIAYQNLLRYSHLGLELHITELDIAIPNTQGVCNTKPYEAQAIYLYQAIVNACKRVNACKVLTFWGLSCKYSWLNQRNQTTILPFDENLNKTTIFYLT
jgi:endo-1,4-beta-xylanase